MSSALAARLARLWRHGPVRRALGESALPPCSTPTGTRFRCPSSSERTLRQDRY